jgi:hypothetical protein
LILAFQVEACLECETVKYGHKSRRHLKSEQLYYFLGCEDVYRKVALNKGPTVIGCFLSFSYRSPSLSDLSGVTSCCGTEAETPDSPVKEGWTKCSQRQIQPSHRTREQSRDATFRSHEKYFDYKMYVFGHKYSSK